MIYDHVLERMTFKKSVFGAVLCIEKGDNTISWNGATGNIQRDDRYFITSVTKPCITAI